MGALLCAAGSPGKRYAMPNARFLIGKCGLEDEAPGHGRDVALEVKEVYHCNLLLLMLHIYVKRML